MKPASFFNKVFILLLFIAQIPAFAQESGAVEFLAQYTPPQGGSYIAGCWGWTDTTTGREYALLGSFCGTSIVEITNTESLVERDFIPNVCSSWKEIQTHENYAYVVSEGGGGVQIIDLSYLPDSAHVVDNFIYTSGGKNSSRVHSLHVKDGYMYLNGSATWSPGGILIFSLANPVAPVYMGEFAGNYIHDCFVRNDTIYGAAIYGQGLQIINATNKTSPQLLHTISYSGAGTHNAATTTDGRYVLTTDEIGATAKTLKIWDVTAPPSFPKVAEYVGSPTAIVHNVFVKDTLAIMSYYTAGIRIVDISDPTDPVELGGYDTYAGGDPTDYDGAWSTYPFFPSGKIIIGDMSTGLYIVRLNLYGPKSPTSFASYSDYQTPNNIHLTWDDPTTFNNGSPLSNFSVMIFRNGTFIAEVDSGVESYDDNSLTLHQYYTYTAMAVTDSDSSAIITTGAYAGGHSTSHAPSSFSATDDLEGVVLSWVNPSHQLDETPLNDLAYILIYRDGALLDSVSQTSSDTGQTRTYMDSIAGFHSYYLKARDNETPRYYSSATSTINAFGKAALSLSESFESDLDNYQTTGSWGLTPTFSSDGSQSLADSPIGNYSSSTNTSIVFSPVILGSKPLLRFKHAAIVSNGDFAFVDISKDQRVSFQGLKVYNISTHSEWADGNLNEDDWITEQVDLTAYAGETVYIRFRLQTNSSNNNDGWYIDEFYLGSAEYEASIAITPSAGWNLVSTPVSVTDDRVTTLFPSAASSAYTFTGSGYAPVDSLHAGPGYWLKFDTSETIELTGPATFRDTFDVHAKWNIVGSVSTPFYTTAMKSIPTGIITSSFYEFNGGYQVATKIEPGKAYWVKTSQAGKLIHTAFTKEGSSSEGISAGLDNMNSLTIRDNAGRTQTLYFGKNAGSGMSLERFDLPPLPPQDAFDARFANHRSVQIAGQTRQAMPVLLQSASYPLTLTWNIHQPELGMWSLETEQGSARLSRQGSRTISSDKLSLLFNGSVSNEQPAEFALEQNYPNPFNPTTKFGLRVANAGLVTLRVYDLLGREVATVLNEELEPGVYTREWNASGLQSSVYYYKMTAGNFIETKTMMLVK